ncbi:MAG TPA: ABC transporter ATP-binding protein [Acidobacteria bacterium]|nr:ABC transporter ATP-binding protein [Acidobacteriota bacterium]
MPQRSPIISVIGLTKSFEGKEVLRGIDLEIYPGESLVVLGGSGAGKSVFLKHLIGLLQPDEGHVVVDGVDITLAEPAVAIGLRKRFGMSFQEGALFDSMTVFDNIAFPLRRHSGLDERGVAEQVRRCLSLVRLEGIERRFPAELSGGMRRRVGFARAIALEPEILLFDEPTTGLDPINTAAIAAVINHMRDEMKVTAVTITHDMSLAFHIADRLAMIKEGVIVAQGDPESFRHDPDPYVQAFLKGEVPAGEEVVS